MSSVRFNIPTVTKQPTTNEPAPAIPTMSQPTASPIEEPNNTHLPTFTLPPATTNEPVPTLPPAITNEPIPTIPP